MNAALDKLLSISSDALLPNQHQAQPPFDRQTDAIPAALREVLQTKNGFFAFESALHVFPAGISADHLTLSYWNDPDSWKSEYGALISADALFFAQDAYGNQFAVREDGVYLFYSEFAEFELVAKSLGEWAEKILDDWRGYTGYDLAHEWQIANRPLREGERLIPKVP